MNTEIKKHKVIELKEHIIEIVCDAGEGAQKSGNALAHTSAKMGNSLWTVEIIPAEIQPPPHSVGSTSGLRIRLGAEKITNGGNLTNLIFAFNEMSLLSRIHAETIADDALIVIDDYWQDHSNPVIRKQYAEILDDMAKKGCKIARIPLTVETEKIVDDARRGKNMFAAGYISFLYSRNMDILKEVIAHTFKGKPENIIQNNIRLLEAGYEYARSTLDYRYSITSKPMEKKMVAMNGNQAIALGSIAAGFELCSMYPITPATSASHYLSDVFESMGGFVHQAEDEIAAIGVAVGAAFVGKPTLTITSGPGMALKTEFMGLTVMTEVPLVLVNVQRGGPSTGLPTKIEQSDLLAALFSTPGDAPKVVLAPSSIDECYHVMKTAREIAEGLRMLVIILSDANLATGVQLFDRPKVTKIKPAPMEDMNPVDPESLPFEWDPSTGLSRRIVPGQPDGASMTSSLNHSSRGLVTHDASSNVHSHIMRSKKLATLQKTLKRPTIFGEDNGDLLIVGWGSTRGAIEEEVQNARDEGLRVSSIHLLFLSPLPPGLRDIFSRFKKIITIEMNYGDPPDDPYFDQDCRRFSQLAMLLRSHTLIDVDNYSRVQGRPLMPMEVREAMEMFMK